MMTYPRWLLRLAGVDPDDARDSPEAPLVVDAGQDGGKLASARQFEAMEERLSDRFSALDQSFSGRLLALEKTIAALGRSVAEAVPAASRPVLT